MTDPDNIGYVQIALCINTFLLSISYWLFQKIYGVDPLTYTIQNRLGGDSHDFQQSQETAAEEFHLVEVHF